MNCNIEESTIFYKTHGLKLYFSSFENGNKFVTTFENWCERERIELFNRYKVNLFPIEIFIIAYYKIIENKGFRIYKVYSESEYRISKSFNLDFDRGFTF